MALRCGCRHPELPKDQRGANRRKPPTSTFEDRSEFDVNTVGLSLLFASDLGEWGKLSVGGDGYHDDVDAVKNRVDLLTGGRLPESLSFLLTVTIRDSERFWNGSGLFLTFYRVSGVRYSHIEAGATVGMFDTSIPISRTSAARHQIAPSYRAWTGSGGRL
ncbi:MAG: hypothetical protein CM1200mP2_57180 [Planctomycetaceae bacterium]|nr:MAG: hypothetical protein CM1200mP2_57180 [Planctomycetaceae bacterium]